MDEEMLRPFFCTQSLGPFVHPGAKLKGGCETKGGCKAATKPTLCTEKITICFEKKNVDVSHSWRWSLRGVPKLQVA